jgi:hypothetical protein
MKGLPKPTETTKVDQKADNKQPPTDSIVGKYRNDASNINLTGNNPPPAPSTPNGPSVSNW